MAAAANFGFSNSSSGREDTPASVMHDQDAKSTVKLAQRGMQTNPLFNGNFFHSDRLTDSDSEGHVMQQVEIKNIH